MEVVYGFLKFIWKLFYNKIQVLTVLVIVCCNSRVVVQKVFQQEIKYCRNFFRNVVNEEKNR